MTVNWKEKKRKGMERKKMKYKIKDNNINLLYLEIHMEFLSGLHSKIQT
jgi:hypothetical protein